VSNRYPFPHERLDAWHRGRAAFQLVLGFTASLPPGFGDEARQIDKAAGSVVRNTCEGADRWRPLEKVHKFEIAAGEAGEAAGAIQGLLDAGVGDTALGQAAIEALGRTCAILMGLIRQHRQ